MIRPEEFLTHIKPMASTVEAYQAFDRHEPGWIKVKTRSYATAGTRCVDQTFIFISIAY